MKHTAQFPKQFPGSFPKHPTKSLCPGDFCTLIPQIWCSLRPGRPWEVGKVQPRHNCITLGCINQTQNLEKKTAKTWLSVCGGYNERVHRVYVGSIRTRRWRNCETVVAFSFGQTTSDCQIAHRRPGLFTENPQIEGAMVHYPSPVGLPESWNHHKVAWKSSMCSKKTKAKNIHFDYYYGMIHQQLILTSGSQTFWLVDCW